DMVHEGRERGRLAAARGSGHEGEPLRVLGDVPDALRQADIGQIRDVPGNEAEHAFQPLALIEDVRAKAAQVRILVAKVDLPLMAEHLRPVASENGSHQALGPFGSGLLRVKRSEDSMDSNVRNDPGGDVEIRGPDRPGVAEQLGKLRIRATLEV